MIYSNIYDELNCAWTEMSPLLKGCQSMLLIEVVVFANSVYCYFKKSFKKI